MARFAFFFLLYVFTIFSEERKDLQAVHFFASYRDCDLRALTDLDRLLKTTEEALSSSGAKVLDRAIYIESPNGLKVVYLLQNSHASLLSYPEEGLCFVDFFYYDKLYHTETFDHVLKEYLKPKTFDSRLFFRDDAAK